MQTDQSKVNLSPALHNEWVTVSGAAPGSSAWETWLKLAHENCQNHEWGAVGDHERNAEKLPAISISICWRGVCIMRRWYL